MRCDCCVAPSSGWKATSRTYFALNGNVGPEKKLPQCVERYTEDEDAKVDI